MMIISPFTPQPRSPQLIAAAQTLGENPMTSKRDTDEQALTPAAGKRNAFGKPIVDIPPPLPHTPEIEAAFGDSANADVSALLSVPFDDEPTSTDTTPEPSAETPIKADNDWIDDPVRAKAFYISAGNLYKFYQIAEFELKQDEWIHLNAKGSVKQYDGQADDLLAMLRQHGQELVRDEVLRRLEGINGGAKATAISLFGTISKAYDKGLTTEQIYSTVDFALASQNQKAEIEQANAAVSRQIAEQKAQEQTMNRNATMTRITNNPIVPQGKTNEWHELTEAEIRVKYNVKMQGGKDYLQVAGRILLFRQKHRLGNITTALVSIDENGTVFRAEVYDAEGKQLSSGYAFTTFAKSDNFKNRVIEKAETSAIGRALAHAGFGTDAAGDDVDEGDMLSDSPVGGNQ